MKKYILPALAGAALCLTSCSDFTDIRTQGGIVPDKIENFRYLLNNTNEWLRGSALPDIMSDDVEVVDGGRQFSNAKNGGEYYAWFTNAYTWSDVIYPATGNYKTDDGWNAMYNTSVYANWCCMKSTTAPTAQPRKRLLSRPRLWCTVPMPT